MSKLAIQGHSTRGSEVIAFLKMLGGKNPYGCNGLGTLCAYHIIEGNIQIVTIENLFKNNEYILYSLEGILATFPYKVGDKVLFTNKHFFIKKMYWENNQILYQLSDENYEEGNDIPNTLIFDINVEKLQSYQEEKSIPHYMDYDVKTIKKMKKEILPYFLTVYDSEESKHEIVATDGYEIKEENGKYYAVKKKSKYPSNYTECCNVLSINELLYLTYTWNLNEDVDNVIKSYDDSLCDKLNNLHKLLICRNAYWKIASEQMGLGKPWEPDWTKDTEKYVIYPFQYLYSKDVENHRNTFLAFPTREMRDTFYENFRDLIEQCKEFL